MTRLLLSLLASLLACLLGRYFFLDDCAAVNCAWPETEIVQQWPVLFLRECCKRKSFVWFLFETAWILIPGVSTYLAFSPRRLRLGLQGRQRNLLAIIFILPIALLFNVIIVILLLLNPRAWKFNKSEADQILDKEMSRFRAMTFEECRKYVESEPLLSTSVTAESGSEYQVQVEAIWDRGPNGPIRIIGSIDDGHLRAYKPLTVTFIVNADDKKTDLCA